MGIVLSGCPRSVFQEFAIKWRGGVFNGNMLFVSAFPHLDQALAFTSALGDVSFARAWAAVFSWG